MLNPLSHTTSTRSRAQRFGLVSLVTASLGQLLILVLHAGFGVGAVLANGSATVVVSIVGYGLCTRFVWNSDAAKRYTVEVPGFVFASFVGLVLSTIVVAIAVRISDHALVPNVASAFGFGLAWVARFAVLDRLLFARPALAATGVPK